jgi:tetrapyrrole methylase family protein/MazG family protein
MEPDANAKAAAGFGRLFEIVRRLRAPDGCPWDRAQTAYTLRGNLIEEAYEAISAIEEGDEENLREELGDLLLVLTMIAYMREQEGSFQVSEVLEHISAKLVRRHPHVFGDARKETPAEVIEQWDHIKENLEGKKPKNSVLDRVPRTLPPLERAFEIQQKVAKVGFDWDGVEPVWDKLAEEIRELREAHGKGDPRRVEAEFGDLLFTVVNLGRLMNLDPTLALNGTNQKFIGRFQELERRLAGQGSSPKQAGLARMDAVWNQIKGEDQNSRSK